MDAKLCDDHHICRNGGQCVPHPNYSGKYTCDCTLNGSDIIYAGLSCDHEATSYCNEDNIPDAVSFCTNGGKCRGNTDESGDHFGCDCPNGYKGNVRVWFGIQGETTHSNKGSIHIVSLLQSFPHARSWVPLRHCFTHLHKPTNTALWINGRTECPWFYDGFFDSFQSKFIIVR